ncbi:MAG: tetratricopeptide repeat protein [Planctomycetota bacterium]
MTRALAENLLIAVALVVLTIIPYAQTAKFDYVDFDDPVYVLENPQVRGGLRWESLKWAFTTGHAGNWHPLTWLSLMLDTQLFGDNAAGHHSVNVLLHVGNVLLVYWFFWRCTRARWESAFIAALYAVHPMHVESVAWISERKDVLSTLFGLLAFLCYVRYAERPGVLRYVAILITYALCLLSKQMLVTFPFLLLLLDYWPLGRLRFGQRLPPSADRFPAVPVRRLVVEKLPMLLLAITFSVIVFLVQRAGGAVSNLEGIPPHMRITNAVWAYGAYCAKTIWPTGLVFFYPHRGPTLSAGEVLVATAFLVLITLSVATQFRRRPFLLVGWLWFLGMLVPVIGLVQVGLQGMADRYAYLPHLGLFLMITFGVSGLVEKMPHLRWGVGVGAAVMLVGLAARCTSQVETWKDSRALFSHAVEVDPENYHGLVNMGKILATEGKLDVAIDMYQRAIRSRPNLVEAHNNLAFALVEKGDAAGAWNHFQVVLADKPNDPKVQARYADLLFRLGRVREAAQLYQRLLASDSTDARLHYNLGTTLVRMGALDEAIFHFRAALGLNAGLGDARGALAGALVARGAVAEGIAAYRDLITRQPASAEPLNNLAWILATHKDARFRNGEEAVLLARRAVERVQGSDPSYLDTLAAAYAEAGDFVQAERVGVSATDLARRLGRMAEAKSIESRLEGYRRQLPYHEPQP